MEKINLTTTKKVKKVAYIKSNNRAKKETRVQDTHYFEFAFNSVIMCNELNYGMLKHKAVKIRLNIEILFSNNFKQKKDYESKN